jgi:hypothetical protein
MKLINQYVTAASVASAYRLSTRKTTILDRKYEFLA